MAVIAKHPVRFTFMIDERSVEGRFRKETLIVPKTGGRGQSIGSIAVRALA